MRLRGEPAGKARELAARPDHAVAGRDDRDRVLAVRRPDRAGRGRPADLARDLAVAAGLAERDREQRRPDALLECGAVEIERNGERPALAGEIGGELPFGLDQD